MSDNRNLRNAMKNKNDEYYTMYGDVEKELSMYDFSGKTVYCNCDNAYESNFVKYFLYNFKKIGIKRLYASCYDRYVSRVIDLFNYNEEERPSKAYYLEVSEEEVDRYGTIDENNYVKFIDKVVGVLDGDGDFRSEECIAIAKKADVLVTNPPFSLFREYIDVVVDNDFKFLIIGNKNAYGFKNCFYLLKEEKIRIGCNIPEKFIKDGNVVSLGYLCRWFTNLDVYREKSKVEFTKSYSKEAYDMFDNYNMINVDKSKDIPKDYYGYMGVPITFFDKLDKKEFDIICMANGSSYSQFPNELKMLGFNDKIRANSGLGTPILNGKATYSRMVIKRKENVL